MRAPDEIAGAANCRGLGQTKPGARLASLPQHPQPGIQAACQAVLKKHPRPQSGIVHCGKFAPYDLADEAVDLERARVSQAPLMTSIEIEVLIQGDKTEPARCPQPEVVVLDAEQRSVIPPKHFGHFGPIEKRRADAVAEQYLGSWPDLLEANDAALPVDHAVVGVGNGRIGVGIKRLDQAFQHVGTRDVVVRCPGMQWPACSSETRIESARQALVGPIGDDADALVGCGMAREDSGRAVGGTVVDADQLEIRKGLVEDRLYRFIEEGSAIVHRQHDADAGRCSASRSADKMRSLVHKATSAISRHPRSCRKVAQYCREVESRPVPDWHGRLRDLTLLAVIQATTLSLRPFAFFSNWAIHCSTTGAIDERQREPLKMP
ncbi:hypothetical protein IM701_00815 [Novosphingobium sp. ES2-1]|nr:hypothetical protein [Novosphingobium sp. ES2-1]QOV95573.1 hypothetical protein IM701_00815 [Novosphingobium sp. ES2-1]